MAGLVISTDLLFADSLCQRARLQGKSLEMRSFERVSQEASSEAISLILIDLSSLSGAVAEAILSLKTIFPAAKLIAFGPHVHLPLLEAATAAGCDEVLTRGQMQQFAQRYLSQL